MCIASNAIRCFGIRVRVRVRVRVRGLVRGLVRGWIRGWIRGSRAQKNHPKSRWFRTYIHSELKSFRLHIVCTFTFVQRLEGVFARWFLGLAPTVLWSVVTASVVPTRSSVTTVSAVVSWAAVFAVIALAFLTFRSWRSFKKYFA